MENEVKLITGTLVTFSIAVAALVLIPYFQVRDIPAPDGLKPYTSADWNLGHLYQPRAYVPESIMPSYPYLFEVKDKADKDEVEVHLPPSVQPQGKVVVAKPEALDLVKYLQSLKRNYPIVPAEPQ